MSRSSPLVFALALAAAFLAPRRAGGAAPAAPAVPPPTGISLNAAADVDLQGVLLSLLGTASDGRPLPAIRLLPAPAPGTPLTLTRDRLRELLARPEVGLTVTNWSGPDRILVSRRMRKLEDAEVLQLLTPALQDRCARDQGELELRLSRPWIPAQVPDDPLTLRLVELPTSGLGPLILVRFELLAGSEPVGSWQTVLQARLWREVWVARNALRRGQTLSDSDFARERRDTLALRDPLADLAGLDALLQAAEGVAAGAPILQRHIRLQPVVHRGQTVNVIVQEGSLNLVMKAEVLEDGAPGQVVRLRNPTSRRELRGKVQNEKTILALF